MEINPSILVNASTILLFSLIWLGGVVFLRVKQKKSLVYLLFFTIFSVYLFKVLDYTLFQFQSLIVLKHFMPNLMLNGVASGESVNLVPLVSLSLEDLKTSLLNILLMVPFGFGLPFITNFRIKKVIIFGMFFSIGIELVQLVTGVVSGITFRIADINDVIFNTLGAALGYLLFVAFVRICRRVFSSWKTSSNSVLRSVAERPQVGE